jgi:hypothetical protein
VKRGLSIQDRDQPLPDFPVIAKGHWPTLGPHPDEEPPTRQRAIWAEGVASSQLPVPSTLPIAASDDFRFTTKDVVMSMNRKPAVGLSTDFTDFTDGREQDDPPHLCFRFTHAVKRPSLSSGSQSVQSV